MPQQTSTFESHFLTHMQGVAGAYHKLIACSWVPILQVGGLGKVRVNCFPKAITTWLGWESNPRPPDPESDALTTLPRCPWKSFSLDKYHSAVILFPLETTWRHISLSRESECGEVRIYALYSLSFTLSVSLSLSTTSRRIKCNPSINFVLLHPVIYGHSVCNWWSHNKGETFYMFFKRVSSYIVFCRKSKLVTVLSLFLFTFLQLPLGASMILGLNYTRSDSRVVI